jgi:hypothetical protein
MFLLLNFAYSFTEAEASRGPEKEGQEFTRLLFKGKWLRSTRRPEY